MAKIRIIACPPGEAPQSIREAWIGLELPLPEGKLSERRIWLTSGVLTGPRALWQRVINILRGQAQVHAGYGVNGRDAVEILSLKDPIAATWWREHAAHALDGKRQFVFPAEVCERC